MTYSIPVLQRSLDDIAKIPNENWLHSLDTRKLRELEFHDQHRDYKTTATLPADTYEYLYGNHKYYQTTRLSTSYVAQWIDLHAKGRVFLDYACGDGSFAIAAAKAGAALAVGIDISPVSIANATANAKRLGLENCRFVQADAENTHLPAESVDVVICSGMLHHLDLSFAFPELRRILAPNGRLLAIEALDYNPLIKLYRILTPQMRTEWEKAHILSLRDVRFASRFFSVGEIRYWHIASPIAAWMPAMLPAFDLLDRALTRVPLMQRMAWIFTFELHKITPA